MHTFFQDVIATGSSYTGGSLRDRRYVHNQHNCSYGLTPYNPCCAVRDNHGAGDRGCTCGHGAGAQGSNIEPVIALRAE